MTLKNAVNVKDYSKLKRSAVNKNCWRDLARLPCT